MRFPHRLLFLTTRRDVSTSLASAFNRLHISPNTKRDILFKRTGLFNIDQLQNPEGFHVLRDNALDRANSIVDQIVAYQKDSQSDSPRELEGNQRVPNVVPLFDQLSNCLCKVADLAEFVRVGHPQQRFRATAEQALVAISGLVERMNTDTRLYKALKAANYNNELDEYVAKLFMLDFEQSAIHLDDNKRQLVLQLNESILKLGSIFAANASQGRLIDPDDMPRNVQQHFSQSGGKILVTGPHADSDNELIREIAYKKYLKLDENQDSILTNLLRCRLQLAQLCGFPSYAHRAVRGSIAGSPEVVKDFLDILNDRLTELTTRDYHQMLQLKQKDAESSGRSLPTELNAWDVPYYSSRYKRSIYSENIMKCLPYFSIGVCMDGLNMIFSKLYGVTMQVDNNCSNGELWHDDVVKLIIRDESSNETLGYIYCDLFERQTKQHQDCHYTIQGGCQLEDGSYQLPIVVLVLSLPDSNDNNPSLLSPAMVDNLFHEMGHAMHSMLARTKYQHITGTRCSTDLAEVPSILMEFFASDPRVVSTFARHHSTGQEMPVELIDCWIKSKRVFMASETQLQVFYAALDQAYHGPQVERLGCDNGLSTSDVLRQIQSKYYTSSIEYVEETAWQLRFSHLVGYGAKYYAYLVSRAVASAIWSRLFQVEPLSRAAGERFRRQVLSHGGGKPAREIAEDVLDRLVDADFIALSVIGSFSDPDKQRAVAQYR